MGRSHYTKVKKHNEDQNAYKWLYTFPNPKINNLFYCCFRPWVPELLAYCYHYSKNVSCWHPQFYKSCWHCVLPPKDVDFGRICGSHSLLLVSDNLSWTPCRPRTSLQRQTQTCLFQPLLLLGLRIIEIDQREASLYKCPWLHCRLRPSLSFHLKSISSLTGVSWCPES